MATNAPGILKRSSSYFVDPKAIQKREGWNTRFDMGDIEALAESIKAELQRDPASGGLLNDVRVKRLGEGKYELIDGERRMTAIWLLIERGVEFPDGIPAKLVATAQDDMTSTIQMFVANSGKPFLPLEEAAAYKRLRDGGMSLADICKAVGRAIPHVTATLALLDAPEELKEAVTQKKIGRQTAKNIVSATKDKSKQAELAKEAAAAGSDKKKKRVVLQKIAATQRAESEARAAKKGKTLKIRALTDDQLSELGAKLAKHLQAQLKAAKMEGEVDGLLEWARKDDQLAVAYCFGALQALKAAAGQKVELEI